METLRTVAHFRLNKGDGMADGLYNLTNDLLLRYTEKEGCSLWFDEDRKNELMAMSDAEFLKAAKEDAGNDIYTKEVLATLWSEITTHIINGKLTQKYRTGLGRTFYKGDTLDEIKEWLEGQFKMPINYAYKKTYYQPDLPDELWGTNEGLYSFEVYRSKEKCQEDFPGYEALEYSGNDIEDPTYVD